jgi:hypothetical protein
MSAMVTLAACWVTTPALAETPGSESPPGSPGSPLGSEASPSETRGPEAPSARAELRHAPPSTAAGDDDLMIHAEVTHPEQVRETVLYFTTSDGKSGTVTFQRSVSDDYVAMVPREHLRGEALEYYVAFRLVNGAERAVFGSAERRHRVQVVPSRVSLSEQALLQRLRGRRNAFRVGGEYVDFGRSETEELGPQGTPVTRSVRDRYYRIDGSYTHRPLRVISEFWLRLGVVRGESPVPYTATGLGGEPLGERKTVGLNYGAPGVRFRFADWLFMDSEVLASVTEVGFSAGAGGALLVGDPYGTKLVLGAETVAVFGTRFYSRTELGIHPLVRVAPIIEVTNMPHANQYGVRLLGEVTVDLGHRLGFSLRGGYQARKFDSGGPGVGAGLAYEL